VHLKRSGQRYLYVNYMSQSDIFLGKNAFTEVSLRYIYKPHLQKSLYVNSRWNVFESVAYFYIVFINNISH
jgi:hypothetical protein